MNIMLDTNIILDSLITERAASFPESVQVINMLLSDENNTCFVSASAITDIHYLLRKSVKSDKVARSYIRSISRSFAIANVCDDDIFNALESDLSDFEDSVVDAVATRLGCEYIISRNNMDFVNSQTAAVTPAEMLAM